MVDDAPNPYGERLGFAQLRKALGHPQHDLLGEILGVVPAHR
jgi:hypothetical protein